MNALPVSMPCVFEERDIGRNNEDKKKDVRSQGKPGGKGKKSEDSKRVQLHKDNGCDYGPVFTTGRPLLKSTKVLCALHSVCVCIEIETYQISENLDYV